MEGTKFRFWEIPSEKYIYDIDALSKNPSVLISKVLSGEDTQIIAEQFTGKTDKNGNDIYKGSIIKYRFPYRESQTHTGDNIPNGSYTEPMEPAIMEITSEVIFKDGIFGCYQENESGVTDNFVPLCWLYNDWDEENIKCSIANPRNDIWDDPEEGDLQYLLEQYNLKNVDDLIEYCSVFEVIGNIHQNPELL